MVENPFLKFRVPSKTAKSLNPDHVAVTGAVYKMVITVGGDFDMQDITYLTLP